MTEPKKEEKKDRFVVVDVTVQTAPAIIDTTQPEDSKERIVAVFAPEQEGHAKVHAIELNNLENMKGLL